MRLPRQILLLRRLCRQIFGSCGSVGKFLSANFWLVGLLWKVCDSIGKFGFCGSSASNYVAPLANLAFAVAPLANSWLRWQIWLLRQLRRQIFGFDGSVGNHYAPTANLASGQPSRQIFGSVGKYLAPSANNWLHRQIIGSVGQFSFCGSSVGKYLAPSAQSAIMLLRQQIWLLGSSAGKYLARLANIWLFGSVGK
jgi:hypothetical protein